jgi:Protein of unknown function (DUF3237)
VARSHAGLDPAAATTELLADTPRLEHVADLTVRIATPLEIGRIAGNLRRVIPIAGGEVLGPRIFGRVLPGGADFQVMRADGITDLHARYVIETPEGHLIYVENTGVRSGPPELLEKIRQGEAVDPALIYFRSTPRFETAAPGYEWLMQNLFVCSGARFPNRVELRFFRVA